MASITFTTFKTRVRGELLISFQATDYRPILTPWLTDILFKNMPPAFWRRLGRWHWYVKYPGYYRNPRTHLLKWFPYRWFQRFRGSKLYFSRAIYDADINPNLALTLHNSSGIPLAICGKFITAVDKHIRLITISGGSIPWPEIGLISSYIPRQRTIETVPGELNPQGWHVERYVLLNPGGFYPIYRMFCFHPRIIRITSY